MKNRLNWDSFLFEWLELADHADDRRSAIVDGVQNGALIVEGYCRGEHAIHLHIGFKHPLGHFDTHDFYAEYHRVRNESDAGGVGKLPHVHQAPDDVFSLFDVWTRRVTTSEALSQMVSIAAALARGAISARRIVGV